MNLDDVEAQPFADSPNGDGAVDRRLAHLGSAAVVMERKGGRPATPYLRHVLSLGDHRREPKHRGNTVMVQQGIEHASSAGYYR
ncbi:hypothetical protein OPT61_g10687 [Boeremia exigua]|uniref:Uncharacterized protein n=1 Tax=Boeremia exigua TaxID=749465 RepID=A0ACC2HNB9_9PLEO|nr:hypothetical protein OPT61_g10687 [Boeremia exigua]